jgi:hypothetical protein
MGDKAAHGVHVGLSGLSKTYGGVRATRRVVGDPAWFGPCDRR